MASPDELLAMLEEAAEEAENAHRYGLEDALHQEPEDEYAEILEDLTNEIIDEVTLGLCFDVHKSCKIGTFLLDDIDRETELKFGKYDQSAEEKKVEEFRIVVEKGKDVFGQVPMKKQLECVCPNCQRNLAASRFAPHLEKCMGMGRNSSRIASRRIAKSGKKDSDDSDGDEENQKDDEWLTERKVKKQRRDRSTNSPRRSKSLKAKNSVIDRSSDIPSVGSNASNDSGNNLPIHETLSKENCRSLLSQTCGVISEHTKKMCTRSHRCPQHSDEQRRAVRAHLLGQQGLLPDDDIQVDIDTYEEGDSQALRDSLQWDAASNPSPADSTSTINSTTSSRKKKTTKSKKKSNAKISNSTGVDTPNSMYDFSTI